MVSYCLSSPYQKTKHFQICSNNFCEVDLQDNDEVNTFTFATNINDKRSGILRHSTTGYWHTEGRHATGEKEESKPCQTGRLSGQAPGGYRGYSDTHFYGIQSKINNQFAEFVMQAATFAANVQRDRTFYYSVAKTCKLLRRRIIDFHFLIYMGAVVVPCTLGLIMAIFVWRSLVRQIDGIVKAPPDGSVLPPLANKPPGFYVPLHRRPIIYLQLIKEKCFGKKGAYQENILRRRKKAIA
uniref:Uncharacterized protein n=1 Tax=Setaria digitata TaxID=48799 RepID=A0A915PRX5_9BILA